jgi:hypothetical protein
VLLGLLAACSSRDQSLGETRSPSPAPTPQPQPGPIPQPQPDPNPDPAPDPQPTPDPQPQPDPNPTPSVPPCEDRTLHPHIGACLPIAACPHSITYAGYECVGDAVCCDQGVGCGMAGCGAPPAAGGQGGDASLGAGGTP